MFRIFYDITTFLAMNIIKLSNFTVFDFGYLFL